MESLALKGHSKGQATPLTISNPIHVLRPIFIAILTGIIAIILMSQFPNRIHASDGWATVEAVAVGGMIVGGVYGVGDALIRGNDVFKSGWDGAKFGATVPGMIGGGITGIVLGTLVHGATFQPVTEEVVVGWGSAGAVAGVMTGQLLMMQSRAKTLNRIIGSSESSATGYLISGTYDFLYWGNATIKGLGYANYARATYATDTEMHYWTSKRLRDITDPGTALTLGFAKEAGDYFLGLGHPEYRDLGNNWRGVFREDLTQ